MFEIEWFLLFLVLGIPAGVAFHELGHLLALLLFGQRDVDVWIWCKPADTAPQRGRGVRWMLGVRFWTGEVRPRSGEEPQSMRALGWALYTLGGCIAAAAVGLPLLFLPFLWAIGFGAGTLAMGSIPNLWPASRSDGMLCLGRLGPGPHKRLLIWLFALLAVGGGVAVGLLVVRAATARIH